MSAIATNRHAATTIVLHWLTAVLVVLLWTMGETQGLVPRGALRADYRSLHILLGFVLAAVLIGRIAWRVLKGGLLADLQTGWMATLAHAVHKVLYGLLIAALAFGIATALARGDTIFGLLQLPHLFEGDRATVRLIRGWHALAANGIMILAGLHSASALFHHFVLRDATLRRMRPWG